MCAIHFMFVRMCIQNHSICSTVNPVLSDHIKQDIFFFAFQTGGRSLLNESSAESSVLRHFHSAISNHLSKVISMSPEWMVAKNRFNCISL